MPLHKPSRAHRLDPTMISAPLGDFRHTMHIGRGGDAFGDTSFLSTAGPSPTTSELSGSGILPAADLEAAVNHGDLREDASQSPQLQHSESMSSLTMDLDLDLDLGPSILGDVLGVMDSLSLYSNGEAVLSPRSDTSVVEMKAIRGNMETSVNGNGLDEDGRIPDENGLKSRGLKPKVRFSDKREEIIRQPSEEEEGQTYDLHDDEDDDDQLGCHSPARDDSGRRKSPAGEPELSNHNADLPPSPSSSHSSELDGVTELDRRRSESVHSETDSEEEEEEEEEEGRGYSFEDESDDEIGL
ncbi:cdc42 effector protein 5 [Xiphophorus couchianus]|uniref:cdc42 effector protein 5 n=1 Tax=Xiphophorus couchianus TaxID=32473 RepID=UPI001016C7C3|nr:cdc42 effector protein 5 [Xiphophorus couchianus]